jgi:succinate dehydrogenase/fumarate reductase cytochrome b subunit (b558 family)
MPSPGKDTSLRWTRLHAISGVVPLGAFLVLHLWVQSHAVRGPREYERVLREAASLPGVSVLEVVGIYAPLLFHAAYGIFSWMRADTAPARAPRPTSWSRPLQRATGLVTATFVSYHLFELPIARLAGRLARSDFFSTLADRLSSTTSLGVPIAATFYLFGLGAASYHLANGFMGFLLDFELVRQPSRRAASVACTILGTVVFLIGARTIVYFATGSVLP